MYEQHPDTIARGFQLAALARQWQTLGDAEEERKPCRPSWAEEQVTAKAAEFADLTPERTKP